MQAFRLEMEVKRLQSREILTSTEQKKMERKESDLDSQRRAAVAERRDSAILDLIGFMESALQLSLQLYLCIQFSLPLSFTRGKFVNTF